MRIHPQINAVMIHPQINAVMIHPQINAVMIDIKVRMVYKPGSVIGDHSSEARCYHQRSVRPTRFHAERHI